MIGINNRDLKTLAVDLGTTLRLAPEVPPGRLVVAESGIRGPEDLGRLAAAGAARFSSARPCCASRMSRRRPGASSGFGELTHLDAEGRARMVDVSEKDETDAHRASPAARVVMRQETLARIRAGEVAKGDVLAVARLAGIMAAKRTAELIPLCHPLALTSVEVDLRCVSERSAVEITATCRVRGRTGVEMEALTAASVAALTIYDMCKAIDRGMTVTDVRLLYKSGGKSGTWEAIS